jgi:hypothetical protein
MHGELGKHLQTHSNVQVFRTGILVVSGLIVQDNFLPIVDQLPTELTQLTSLARLQVDNVILAGKLLT